ncbi:MAG: pyrroline-5-carboxylate reductase [Verrucomicrobiota bacterium]|nr:pyrroline-5-carboxylate reductase [Verrucomicrobiota bacterium]
MGNELTIGFLGAGKMASALAKGMINAQLVSEAGVLASDPVAASRESFKADTKVTATGDNREVVRKAQVLFIAVKPDQVRELLREIQGEVTANHLIVSIAAGIPTSTLENQLPPQSRVIRVMPNTPALVGASASAYARGQTATAQDAALVEKLLSSVGLAYEVKELLLDAVTGLSGSGPAYAYLLIEALSDGGVAEGLPREIATKLAAQTLLGAAKMVLETGKHPGALKDMVTSPGGTTIEGLHQLELGGVRGALIDAVRAASEKSRQLGGRS